MKGWVLIFGELYAIGKIYTKLNLKFILFMGFSVTDYWILTSAFDFEEPQKEGMETHSNVFAWRIPWTEETGGLQSIGSKRVRHNSATFTSTTVGSLLHFFPVIIGLAKRSIWVFHNILQKKLNEHFVQPNISYSVDLISFLFNLFYIIGNFFYTFLADLYTTLNLQWS